MKKLLYLLPLGLLGCETVTEIKEGVQNAPEDFWINVREVLLFLWEVISGALGGLFQGLLG